MKKENNSFLGTVLLFDLNLSDKSCGYPSSILNGKTRMTERLASVGVAIEVFDRKSSFGTRLMQH